MIQERKNDLKALKKNLNDMGQPTWFDLGIFLDKLSDDRAIPDNHEWRPKSFLNTLSGGVAFITFDYGIDGVTIEIAKYAKALENILTDETDSKKLPTIHWVAETFKPESDTIIEKRWKKFQLNGGGGFVDWDGYSQFFHTKLKRGSTEYNDLIENLWKQTKELTTKLADYVVKNDIQLLFPVNVCSNPGNVALALSIVIVSESLKIPVFNNSHDFFWENGGPEWKSENGAKGIRDHFFTNAHLGEVHSLVENLYPWHSPLWFHTTINEQQRDTLTETFGISPGNISTIPTVIDADVYKPVRKYERQDILTRTQYLLAGSEKGIKSQSIDNFIDMPNDGKIPTKPLFLGIKDGIKCDLTINNLLFIQPTRILLRKDISRGFDLIKALLGFKEFKHFFDSAERTITLLVTGPVTSEHLPYLSKLLNRFKTFLNTLPAKYQERIFLSFKFGIETSKKYEKKGFAPLQIHEIYSVANLVLLPSQQEGRGLPLLESSACAVPIMTNRFDPEDVFKEVTGEDLEASMRLRVLEFPKGNSFDTKTLDKLTGYFADYYYNHGDLIHNVEVISKRFTQSAIDNSLKDNFSKMSINLCNDSTINNNLKEAFLENEKATVYFDAFKKITLSKNRKYLPGLTELEYMIQLQSLIDPSSFRMEEKTLRGRIFVYALKMMDRLAEDVDLTQKQAGRFLKHVVSVFDYYTHNDELVVDHSYSYRHRNTRHYPYRKLTEPELCGVVGLLFRKVISKQPTAKNNLTFARDFHKDMRGQIQALAGSRSVVIDDTETLVTALKSKRPIAWFHGGSFTDEVTLFVERTLRRRLKLKTGDRLTEKHLKDNDPVKIGEVSLFAKYQATGRAQSERHVVDWIAKYASEEIKLFYKYGYFKIIPTQVLSAGVHLGQLGPQASQELLAIKDAKGFVIGVGQVNMMTLDLLDLESFRVGTCTNDLFSNYMGLEIGDGFVQWVPAGLRPSLAYPTPIQTPVEFSKALASKRFENLASSMGKSKLLNILRKDADQFGTPLSVTLKDVEKKHKQAAKSTDSKKRAVKPAIESNLLTGIHSNGDPWSGAYAKCVMDKNHTFKTAFAGAQGDTVLSIIDKLEAGGKNKISMAWNGGYILNPELVGKLSLPEDYIGSPLGLLLANKQIQSLPLFNKPALVFLKDGTAAIREAHMRDGVTVCSKKIDDVVLTKESHNNPKNKGPVYYDLLFGKPTIPAAGRVVFRFSGDTIIEKVSGEKQVDLLPVGLSVTFIEGTEPKNWKPGLKVSYKLPGWEDVQNAIEAGPLLVRDGEESIEMVEGGWKTKPSIATQAARVDYTHMRGPKIAVGITKENELLVVAINGRIRESVGATHVEMSKILLDRGCTSAMGFDPGGSVTLVVDNKQLNISPYNKDYLKNPFSLPPQPRFVSNAIVAIKNK